MQDDIPCAVRSRLAKIACETWNGWDVDDYSELATCLAGTDNSLNNGPPDDVMNGCLMLACRSNFWSVSNLF